MKFTIAKEQIINGLQAVQNVVSTRTTLPILANVLLEAKENKLDLTATDLDVTIRCSVEATILLVAAALVMLGNVPIGQALTNWIPNEKTDIIANLRLENIGQWIQKRASSPATMAIDFGLAVGALATSLRLWLSLERGSYFEEEL